MSGQLGVIGAGTMGAGIAYVSATAGYDVTLVEVDPERGNAAGSLIDTWARRAVDRGRAEPELPEQVGRRLTIATSIDDIPHGADVIVEAVPERPELKRDVLTKAETREPKLLGSNTSSISIDSLAEGLNRPERFCGLHFFNPVYAMRLLEIVTGGRTSNDTTAASLAFAERLGKDPIVVADAPGFATSRLGNALGLEAMRMLESGVADAADIDKAMSLGYKHPVGPLELSDMVGLDVRLDIARTLQEAYGDRFTPPQLLIDKVERGELGKKSGSGFYRWQDGRKVEE
ncbi:MAG TPA: 3-hydroxyacyl-CoA dehydrogenase family protein [Candidatus Stackebrandtia faecavium]|nr:3-hydroxyacyl-CoA dehydrogenase family protein [Candidatus Stackebrandtia faecavium]